MNHKITIVFEIRNRDDAAPFYEAHRNNTEIHGLIPVQISSGDQVTVPGDILDDIIDLDADFSNPKEIKKIIEKAQNHYARLAYKKI